MKQFNLDLAYSTLHELFIHNWILFVSKNKKTSLYESIKCEFSTEPYVYRIYNKRNRSLLARLRAGCLDLEIEPGRWRGIHKDERICKLCGEGIENESHFLFHCCKLDHVRELYGDIFSTDIIDDNARFKYLCSEDIVLKTSKLVRHLYDERKHILYKE